MATNIDPKTVDTAELKVRLTDKEVTFAKRAPVAKLIELAAENDIEVPLKPVKEPKPKKEPKAKKVKAEGDENDENDEGEDGDEDEKESGNVVPAKYREKYGAAQNCGDELADVLSAFVMVEDPENPKKRVCSRSQLETVADANGLQDKMREYEESGKNLGMVRMNIGNILRGRIRRGQYVKIGGAVWEAKEEPKGDAESGEAEAM